MKHSVTTSIAINPKDTENPLCMFATGKAVRRSFFNPEEIYKAVPGTEDDITEILTTYLPGKTERPGHFIARNYLNETIEFYFTVGTERIYEDDKILGLSPTTLTTLRVLHPDKPLYKLFIQKMFRFMAAKLPDFIPHRVFSALGFYLKTFGFHMEIEKTDIDDEFFNPVLLFLPGESYDDDIILPPFYGSCTDTTDAMWCRLKDRLWDKYGGQFILNTYKTIEKDSDYSEFDYADPLPICKRPDGVLWIPDMFYFYTHEEQFEHFKLFMELNMDMQKKRYEMYCEGIGEE